MALKHHQKERNGHFSTGLYTDLSSVTLRQSFILFVFSMKEI
jgi:hypothetical protein